MKRCPDCYSSFPDTVQFCDLDGARLVADYSDINPDLSVPREDRGPQTETSGGVGAGGYQIPRDSRAGPLRQSSLILSLVAIAGVVLAVVLFIVYQLMTREGPEQSSNQSSNVAVTQQQIPLLPSRPSPASPSPSPTPSPSPSPMPSPATQAESVRGALSSSVVSTGGNEKTRRGPVTIQLTNGTSIEADEVWETREGIWYRRRGVVTLLERDQVKAIEKPSPASSASPTPATSPGATP
jgi:hypothetical protein